MGKLRLTVVQDAYDNAIDFLHSAGCVEVEAASNDLAGAYEPKSKAEYWQASVKFALDLLEEHEEPTTEKVSLLEKLQGNKTAITEIGIRELLSAFDYKSIVAELEDLDKEHTTIKNRIARDEKEQRALEDWKGLPVTDGTLGRHVSLRIGTVPTIHFQDFTREWGNLGPTELVKIGESDKEVRVVLCHANDVTDTTAHVLEVHDFKDANIDLDAGVSVEQRIEQLGSEIAADTEELAKVAKSIRAHASKRKDLEVVYDHLTWKKDQEEASRKALATKQSISLTFWMPDHRREDVEKGLDAITSKYAIEDIEIDDDEDIPVVLRNADPITPFESVTEIYGVPQYDEPDPTVYLAPFFIVYFALCLTDAGYGLVLAVLTFVALKAMKPKGGAKKLMTLLMMSGVATFIVGAMFGGWFGIVLDELPDGPITRTVLALRLMDPVANPMSVLVLSFILGFIQMVAGNLVNMTWHIRHGRAKEGLLSGGVWALFLLLIGAWIAAQAGALPESAKTPTLYLVAGGAIMLVLTQGREKASLPGKLFGGIASLYGLVGYLSDILSYSRLLALGLSTGIIAMVVNLVADLFAGMVPYVGWLVWILIIVGGHLFNLAINVLGAFIHSGRLQYVEYFPKFLAGGGRKFRPLVKTAKYITPT